MAIKIGKFFFRHRHLLYIPFVLAIFLMDKSYHNLIKPYDNLIVAWSVGIGLLFLGCFIRVWAVRYCGKRTVYKREGGKWLTLTGPYSFVRNPLYHSNILIGCGLIMLGRLVWLLPIFVVVGYLYYHFVVLYEESRLRLQFRESYEMFRKNVPRWVPRLTPYRPNSDGKLNQWSEVYGAEKLRFLAVLLIIFLITLKDLTK